MTKEALNIALKALEEAADAIDSWGSYASGYFQVKHDLEGDISKAKSAITAIKEALAQPEQEPVAWVSSEELLVMRGNALGGAKDWRINVGLVKQENDVGLYTTPPQRPSRSDIKPLTDKELNLIGAQWHYNLLGKDDKAELFAFARAIEAAHGIKGGA
jgi:hypothetical protein